MKTFEFKVKMEMQFNCKKNEAYDKLKSWLEHNGHTATGHGFEFKEVDYIGRDEE